MRYAILILLFSLISCSYCFGQQNAEVLKELDAKIAKLKTIEGVEILIAPEIKFLKLVQRVNDNEALMEDVFYSIGNRGNKYIYWKGANDQWQDDVVVEVLNGSVEAIDFQTPEGLKRVKVAIPPTGLTKSSFELYLCRKKAASIMYADFYGSKNKKIYIYKGFDGRLGAGTKKGNKISKYRAEVKAVWCPSASGKFSSRFSGESVSASNSGGNLQFMPKPYATDTYGEWMQRYGEMKFATVRNNKEFRIYRVIGTYAGTRKFVYELYKESYYIYKKYLIVPDGRLFDYPNLTRPDGSKSRGGEESWEDFTIQDVSEEGSFGGGEEEPGFSGRFK